VEVIGVKSARQLNSSAEYDVDDDDDVGLVLCPGAMSNEPEERGCGLGLGKALLTDAERGISDPGGGLRSSKELLPLLAAEDVAGNVISLDVASGTSPRVKSPTCKVVIDPLLAGKGGGVSEDSS